MPHDREALARVVLACGGTGGHVYPALAIAREIQRRRPEAAISFVGRPESFESRAILREGFELDGLEVGRLVGQGAWRRIATLAGLPGAVLRARAILRRRAPTVVIGTGGFVSGPTMLAAVLDARPTLVQEQNARAGLTNRVLRRLCDRVALGHPEPGLEPPRHVVTGNPVRAEFFAVPPFRLAHPLTVLVLGGSQGARSLNEACLGAAPLLADVAGKVRFVLQCGPRWEQELRERARGTAVDIEVHAFLHDVPRRLADAQLVICRAGASTVAEVCAAGRAAVLVPFPHAAGDHQSANAAALEAQGAAERVADADLDGEAVARRVRQALARPEELRGLADRARALGRPEAAARIVDLAVEAAALRAPRRGGAAVGSLA